jgi:hypothetical protein
MRSYEHRAVGDTATAGALVNLGGASADEAFWLSFGDVVALSGDFFRPRGLPLAGGEERDTRAEAATGGMLFHLARIPGQAGTLVGTRDEIVCALKATSSDTSVIGICPWPRSTTTTSSPPATPTPRRAAASPRPHPRTATSTKWRWRRHALSVVGAVTSPGPWPGRPRPSTT